MEYKFLKLDVDDANATHNGKFAFRRLKTDLEPVDLAAGLFDADDRPVASWDELVNTYGMDISENYTDANYASSTTSPYYVLNSYQELYTGVRLVISCDIKTIGSSAFSNCTSLESVVIGDGVTSIGNSAFFGCTSLVSIEIPDSVTSIGGSTFSGCTSLESVVIPDSVTRIEPYAFYKCTSLENIVIPDSVTSIGYIAFAICAKLVSVEIPDSVTSIEDNAFYRCTSLTDIYYTGTESEWNAISKSNANIPTSATIHYNYIPTSMYTA